jgi:protein-L-isoaspartate(D-aspartate) O-methyltransferase
MSFERPDILQARSRYASAIASSPGADDRRVVGAFSTVPREHFLGRGPWMILGREGYTESATADPTLLYDDIVVALAPDKRINNGQPSLHARCLSAARIQPGERVLHIGCGTGYYSAILSELVGASGAVDAWDVEPALADAARRNLRQWANASVTLRSGTAPPIPESDIIYVCAGCTQPLREWVDALSDGGRLLFPLTPGWDAGGMLMITRDAERYRAEFVCRCSFIPSIGGSTVAHEAALRDAFAQSNMDRVSALHFGDGAGREGAWLAGDDWWLSASPTQS